MYSCLLCQAIQGTCQGLDTDFKVLASQLEEILSSCSTEEERQAILRRLAPLRNRFDEVKNVVETKSIAQSLLMEHQHAVETAQTKITKIQNDLLSENLTEDEVSRLVLELEEAKDQLHQLEAQQVEVRERLAEAGLVCLDRVTGEQLDIVTGVSKLASDYEQGDAKLRICERIVEMEKRLRNAGADLGQLRQVYVDDLDKMGTTVQVI